MALITRQLQFHNTYRADVIQQGCTGTVNARLASMHGPTRDAFWAIQRSLLGRTGGRGKR